MSSSPPAKRFYRVRELVDTLGISKGKVWALIKDGTLKAIRLEGVVLIPAGALDAYLDRAEPWRPRE